MKTDEILNIDCREEKNINVLNKFLWKIKPIQRIMEKELYNKGDVVPMEILEKSLHGICMKNGYTMQHLNTYYDEKGFRFYTASVVNTNNKTRDWIGNVYGVSMWETLSKVIIKIYADVKKGEQRYER